MIPADQRCQRCNFTCGHVAKAHDGKPKSAPCRKPKGHNGEHSSWKGNLNPESPCNRCYWG